MDIKETIVVEGKDDQSAVLAAVNANIICTHGYGISENTFELIKTAYENNGIIIFTDPDHAGRAIRSKLSSLYPNAKHAYLTRDEAFKEGDIGIENAKPEVIQKALRAANATKNEKMHNISLDDMFELGLAGAENSAELRNELGKKLGIGYGNVKSFLKRLNSLDLSIEEISKML